MVDQLGRDVGSVDLSDYGARLRRRWWAVVAGILIGLAAGQLFTQTQTPQYTTRTSVQVQPTGAPGSGAVAGGRTNGEVNLDTEAQLVASAQVAEAAKELMRVDTPVGQLQKNVNVSVPPNSQILSIEYTAETAKRAQEGSHAFAQAYLTDRSDRAKKEIADAVASLKSQQAELNKQLKAATDKSAGLEANSPDRAYADAQRAILQSQITDIASRMSPLVATKVTPGTIITDAPLPPKPSSPIPALNLAAGLLAGLLLGLAVAMFLDRSDHRLRRPGDVSRRLGLPVLAQVPVDRTAGGRLPGSDLAGHFDRLRNAIIGGNSSIRVVQTSDTGQRGATGMVALQLAASLARSSHGATLVVAHPDSPIPSWLGLAGRPGLVEMLRGEASLAQVSHEVSGLPGVRVVGPGRDPHALDTVLQSAAMPDALRSLRDSSASVVIESHSTGESAAAQAISREVDSLLLVVERGITDARKVAEAASWAHRVLAPLAGVVLAPAYRRPKAAGPSSPARGGRRGGPAQPATAADTADEVAPTTSTRMIVPR